MCCTPTLCWLIVLTLPRYHCPLNRLPASRLLLPRSGLERSDFVRWPFDTYCTATTVGRKRGIAEIDRPTSIAGKA
jgi:hypothetical protein